MPIQRVRDFLEREGNDYAVIPHPVAYTAQEEAAAAHVPGAEWAKTVVFFGAGQPGLAVLPATRHVDLERLALAADTSRVRLATEAEMADLFPDCEVGAVPPFGGLWGLPVYLDRSLAHSARIAFHAGSHREAVTMGYADFERLLGAVIVEFAEPGGGGLAGRA
ncbi:MAG: YbaK/EbsC family protein [Gemmatimonadetes bacterium]|nr:YbaK/EbsC family protein [Gemmatimonadota bacterium]